MQKNSMKDARRVLAAAAAISIMMSVCGCGDSDNPGTPSNTTAPPATTKGPTGSTNKPVTVATTTAKPTTPAEERLTIKNSCNHIMYIVESTNGTEKLTKIPGNSEQKFYIGGPHVMEFTPKMGCDSDGNACLLGNRGQNCGPWGCAPSINTKFQWQPADGKDQIDTTLANGFTVPFKLTVGSDCDTGIAANMVKGANIDCHALDLKTCPTQKDVAIGSGGTLADVDLTMKHPPASPATGWTQEVGCYSPCSILTLNGGLAPAAQWNPNYGTKVVGAGDPPANTYCTKNEAASQSGAYCTYVKSKCTVAAATSGPTVQMKCDGNSNAVTPTCSSKTKYTFELFCPNPLPVDVLLPSSADCPINNKCVWNNYLCKTSKACLVSTDIATQCPNNACPENAVWPMANNTDTVIA